MIFKSFAVLLLTSGVAQASLTTDLLESQNDITAVCAVCLMFALGWIAGGQR